MEKLKSLKPENVFYFFEKISSIPRCSGNEKAVSDYIADFARKKGLWVHQDEKNNLIIRKDAAAGYESIQPVIIQGHLDMVCEKNADTEHDFDTQPIELVTDGEYVWANATTLGADNGIAVAYAMALLDGDYAHPPIEVLLTTNEETGMDGAAFVDASLLTGKRIINIDEETEGRFIVSCAGGLKSVLHIPLEFEDVPKGMTLAVLEVKGLIGGHSGMEIDKQRANANILLGRILRHVCASIKIKLCDLTGGSKDNAIPREAVALFLVDTLEYDELRKCVLEKETEIRHEYRMADKDIRVTLEKAVFSDKGERTEKAVSEKSLDSILSLLTLVPDGAFFYGTDPGRTVETSNNVGVMRIEAGEFKVENAIRSSVASRKEYIREKLVRLAVALGGYETKKSDYPAWEYAPESRIREIFVEAYARMFGKNPEVSGIHAGLECGIFAKKINSADMIAFGPDIYGAHSPDERMSVSSVGRMWEFLLMVLEEMK